MIVKDSTEGNNKSDRFIRVLKDLQRLRERLFNNGFTRLPLTEQDLDKNVIESLGLRFFDIGLAIDLVVLNDKYLYYCYCINYNINPHTEEKFEFNNAFDVEDWITKILVKNKVVLIEGDDYAL